MSSFNTMNLTPDDPRLTAYALGELEGAEHLAIENAVAADPELEQAVAEIRGTAEQLSSAFETEPAPIAQPIPIELYLPQPTTTRLPYWVAGSLVAASFAILFLLVRTPGPPDVANKSLRLVRVDTGSNLRPEPSAPMSDTAATELEKTSGEPKPDTVAPPADALDSEPGPVDLKSAEITFATSSDALLANVGEAVRRESRIPGRTEPPAQTETTDFSEGFRDPQVALPAPPRIDPATNRPESLLRTGVDDDSAFQIKFSVRTPAEEIAEFGNRSLESRRLFTSDPDVASNLATVSESNEPTDNVARPNTAFVYDRNRQNVNLRSMFRASGPISGTPGLNQVDDAAPPPPETPVTREPTPEESFQTLIGETVRIAVGLRIPEVEAAGKNGTVAYPAAAYDVVEDNAFLPARNFPLSSVPVDVDSAGYANVRRFLGSNQRPPRGAVRIEEMVNYFDYDYPGPTPDSDETFAPAFEVANAPWNPEHRLVRVALQTREPAPSQRPAANLVFLVDVSGSMDAPHKLPLIKSSLQSAVERLGPSDRIALVVFSPRARVALRSTPVRDHITIDRAIAALEVGGGGAARDGITLAYEVAAANGVPGGINRVVITADGVPDFGGISSAALTDLIAERNRAGIKLTVLGYGVGQGTQRPLDDFLPRNLATVAYVNSPREAHAAMAGPVLFGDRPAARDVRMQIEFNPARVQAYRLIGYENSRLPRAQPSAGESVVADVGPGHAITSLYEVVPVGVTWDPPATMTDRWVLMERNRTSAYPVPDFGELLTVKLRYSDPAGTTHALVEKPLFDDLRSFRSASADFKFASAVAAFGMVMRDSPYRGSASLDEIAEWAGQGIGADRGGYRSEFVRLVTAAQSLRPFRRPATG